MTWMLAPLSSGCRDPIFLPSLFGSRRPLYNESLRLSIVGIGSCIGSAEDIERFTHLLRWLAQKELECESPPPGTSGESFPQVTSEEIREELGLASDDKISLQRIHEMLLLDHWGLGGFGGKPGCVLQSPQRRTSSCDPQIGDRIGRSRRRS
jgi:hypothetical protein